MQLKQRWHSSAKINLLNNSSKLIGRNLHKVNILNILKTSLNSN